jgi:hypothetical protein
MGDAGLVKTTLEIHDATFRRAKTFAAAQGITLKELFNAALEEKLASGQRKGKERPVWLKLAGEFGKTPAERVETRRIQNAIEAEFERIDFEENL